MDSGIVMAMKAFGLDPEKVKLALEQAREQVQLKIDSIETRLTTVETKVDEILARTRRMECHMVMMLKVAGVHDIMLKVTGVTPADPNVKVDVIEEQSSEVH